MIKVRKAGSLIQTKRMESLVQMALMSVTTLDAEVWAILWDAGYIMGAERQLLRPC